MEVANNASKQNIKSIKGRLAGWKDFNWGQANGKWNRGRNFSRVRPFYEWAVSDLDP